MSDTNNRPLRDASLRGDTKGLPDRGTDTGMNPGGIESMHGGMSLDGDATNRLGGMGSGTKSDAADDCYPNPAFADGGNAGYSPDIGGSSMSGTDSDPVGKDKASPSKA